MLPRALMLTTKNAGKGEGVKDGSFSQRSGEHSTFNIQRSTFKDVSRSRGGLLLALAVFLVLCVALTGCKPPGPRALLDGQRLIERGEYAEAVERLKTAISLMDTNAQAWNYLGVAYQESGQPNDAAEAYKKALSLDQNLVEVRYNLGCLWLEQNRPELAKTELTAYTLHRDKSEEGLVKLGEAQLALRDLTGAERTFNQVRLINAQNVEALNDLGMVQMQRNRATEAAQFFNAALRIRPDFASALLNLAIVSQHLNNRQYALERYQDYLALKPKPANSDAVEAVVRSLQQEINPSQAPVAAPTRTAPPTNPPQANPARPANQTPTQTPTRPNRAESTPANPRTTASSSAPPVEVTEVTPGPTIKSAPDNGSASQPVVSSNSSKTAQAEHRGFFSRAANLFRSGSKTDQAPATVTSPPKTTQVVAPTPEPPRPTYPRYSYHSLRKPADGDRSAAEKALVEGSRAQQAKQLTDAAAAYRRATQADPGYFAAYYNLGAVSVQMGNLPQALAAYETALAIQPDSQDARFNFALALKQANYPIDAANELEKLLAKSPNNVNAHYALANTYSQYLRETAKAREHYQKVLELNPNFPQATAVHDWLFANPR